MDRGLIFTLREIGQQPDTWKSTLAIFLQQEGQITKFLEEVGLRETLERRPTVVLVGAGTSDYIGQTLVLLLRRTWKCEVSACASTDLLLNLQDYCVPGRPYLFISFSRSGDSPEGVAVLERAIHENPDIAHLIVTCNAEAKMIECCKRAVRSYAIVLDDAVNDRSLVMTSSFTNMIVMGHCLAHAWSTEQYIAVHEQLVDAARMLIEVASKQAERIASLSFERICFVGSGSLAGIAKEAALKVLEMTAGQVKTMSETLLGLRHGPMAALDTRTLLVCFIPSDPQCALYARDLLFEIGSKHIAAERIALGPVSDTAEIAECCEIYLPVEKEIPDLYRPALDVIFGQLLGLHCSMVRGLKPDEPSPAGVISRVVQQFRIY